MALVVIKDDSDDEFWFVKIGNTSMTAIKPQDQRGVLDSGSARDHYLACEAEGESFVIPIADIREVVEVDCVTPLPGLASIFLGVISYEGFSVPVVDWPWRPGRRGATTKPYPKIVVVEAKGLRPRLGVVVDAVHGILEIPRSAIEPPPDFNIGIPPNLLLGIGHVGQDCLPVLDVEGLIAAEACSWR